MAESRPLRVVLASAGTQGDVQPMVAVSLALAARGHQPLLLAPPDFAPRADSLGLAFRPLGLDVRSFIAGRLDQPAALHHGGSGTTAAALRAGVPQVVLPLILDQYHHAHRLHLAGLAPRPVPMERVTAPQLTAAMTGGDA